MIEHTIAYIIKSATDAIGTIVAFARFITVNIPKKVNTIHGIIADSPKESVYNADVL